MKHRLMWLIAGLVVLLLATACSSGEARPTDQQNDIQDVAPVTEATSAPESAPAAEHQLQAAPAESPADAAQLPAESAPADVGVQGAAKLPPAEANPVAPAAQSGLTKVGLVAGPIDDRGFNQLAWEGLQRAAAELGFEPLYSPAAENDDTTQNINDLLSQGANGVVTVGFGLAQATKAASEANPNIPFIGVDFPSQTAGDLGLLFDVDEPSFMAGYLAAGMTQTGIVCTYGGRQTPPVLAFMVGFENGVNYYNQQTGAGVQVLGWQTNPADQLGGSGVFANSFTDASLGRDIAADFASQGCDIIFPVAGAVGLGSAQVAQEQGLKVIGIDADQTQTNPEYADVYLTSVLKKIDVVVYDALKIISSGEPQANATFRNNFIGSLANDGVGLAPFHNFDSQIPQDLKDSLANLKDQLASGELFTGWPIGGTATMAAKAPPPPAPAPPDQTLAASKAAPAAGGSLTLDILRNATYQSEWFPGGQVTLTDASYREQAAPGSATEIVVSMTDFVAFGDLTGDGVDDAAVVLVTTPGGSGAFVDLAMVVNANGLPLNVTTFPLGDRVQVKSVGIQNGEVIVDMITHGPSDPLCCPTVAVTKRFKLGVVEEDTVAPTDSTVDPAGFVGMYTASMPSASSPGREVTLLINSDGSAQLSTDYLNGKPPIVEVGNWHDNGDGTMTVSLTGRPDGTTYNRPDDVTFGLQGSTLTAVAWDRNVYGSEGLTLTRQ